MLSATAPRPRAALLAAALSAIATAGAATAAEAAIPRMQQADFIVSATATQTTTWKKAPGASTADCSPILRFSGEGRETVAMTLKPARFTAYRVGRQLSLVAAPGRDGFGPQAWAKVSRNGREQAEEIAGSCMDNPRRMIGGGPYDCGTRNRLFTPHFGYQRARLTLGAGEAPLAPLHKVDYDTCPIHVADGVTENGLTTTPSLGTVPAGDLLDPGMRQHIVLGRKTFRLDSGGFRGTTTVRWTVKLTRKGPVR